MNRRYINFGVPEDEYRLIKESADRLGMTPGQYCRFKAIQDARIADLETKIDAVAESSRADIQLAKSEIIKESRELIRTLSTYLITHLKK